MGLFGIFKKNKKEIRETTRESIPISKEQDRIVFVRETQYYDDQDFLRRSYDVYNLSGQNQVIKKTTSTIMDAHNAARSSQNVISYRISLDELKEDMHASDHRLGALKNGKFAGSLVRVLAVKYEEGFGLEKNFERKSIMFSNGNFYLQKITRCVTMEGNGRPITHYNEYVYPINTKNIDEVTPENLEKHVVWEWIFQDVRSEEGSCF